MKNCKCTDNCGCSLSDSLTVGSCNIAPHNYGWIHNTFLQENKPISLNIKPLSQYTVGELLEEMSKRTGVFIDELHKDNNTSIHTITIKK